MARHFSISFSPWDTNWVVVAHPLAASKFLLRSLTPALSRLGPAKYSSCICFLRRQDSPAFRLKLKPPPGSDHRLSVLLKPHTTTTKPPQKYTLLFLSPTCYTELDQEIQAESLSPLSLRAAHPKRGIHSVQEHLKTFICKVPKRQTLFILFK